MSKAEFKLAIAALAKAKAADQAPDFDDFDLAVWIRAADRLVQRGRLDLAAFSVRHMRAQWPGLEWAKSVDKLFRLMPARGPDDPSFADDPFAGAQTIHRPGADAAILVFCGANDRVGMPLTLLHPWLARWPANLIYLRDLRSAAYMNGIEELGRDRAATIEALRAHTAALGARRIVCFGPSLGGYGALRYGLELGAQAVVLMSAMINLDPAFNTGLRYSNIGRRVRTAFPDEVLDLRELYLATPKPPAVFNVYAEHNWDDRIQAEHLVGLEGVESILVPGSRSHNTTLELMRVDQFDPLIGKALGLDPPAH